MAISFKNYTSVSQGDYIDVLSGKQNGTIIKSLQLINGDQSCTVNVVRKNAGGQYDNVRVDLKANDYLILWQGFFVIPYNHVLSFKSTSKCTIVVNAVDLT